MKTINICDIFNQNQTIFIIGTSLRKYLECIESHLNLEEDIDIDCIRRELLDLNSKNKDYLLIKPNLGNSNIKRIIMLLSNNNFKTIVYKEKIRRRIQPDIRSSFDYIIVDKSCDEISLLYLYNFYFLKKFKSYKEFMQALRKYQNLVLNLNTRNSSIYILAQ